MSLVKASWVRAFKGKCCPARVRLSSTLYKNCATLSVSKCYSRASYASRVRMIEEGKLLLKTSAKKFKSIMMFNNFATTQCEWDGTPQCEWYQSRATEDRLFTARTRVQTNASLSYDGTRDRVPIPVKVNKEIFAIRTLVWRKCYQVRFMSFLLFLWVWVFSTQERVFLLVHSDLASFITRVRMFSTRI